MLISGANRGLGLAFAEQYTANGWRVFAACRHPETAKALGALAAASDRITVHQMDVSDPHQIEGLALELADQPIDLLLNNAGVYGDRMGQQRSSFGEIDYDAWAQTFSVNSMGPLRVTEQFISHLEKGEQKKNVILTSKMGSITDNTSGGSYLYRSSKSAVNMVAKCLSIDLKSRGVTVIVMHPGWVATDMGGSGAPMSISESVSGMRRVIDGLTLADSGSFKLHDGSIIPW